MTWRFEHRFNLFTSSPMFSPYFPIRLPTTLLKKSWSQSWGSDLLHQGLPFPGEKAAEPIMKKCSKISQVSRGSKSSKTDDKKEESGVEVRVVPDTLLVSISPDLVCAVIVKEHPWDHYLLFLRKSIKYRRKFALELETKVSILKLLFIEEGGEGGIAVQLNATWNPSIIDTFSSSFYIPDVRVIINMSTLL